MKKKTWTNFGHTWPTATGNSLAVLQTGRRKRPDFKIDSMWMNNNDIILCFIMYTFCIVFYNVYYFVLCFIMYTFCIVLYNVHPLYCIL